MPMTSDDHLPSLLDHCRHIALSIATVTHVNPVPMHDLDWDRLSLMSVTDYHMIHPPCQQIIAQMQAYIISCSSNHLDGREIHQHNPCSCEPLGKPGRPLRHSDQGSQQPTDPALCSLQALAPGFLRQAPNPCEYGPYAYPAKRETKQRIDEQ